MKQGNFSDEIFVKKALTIFAAVRNFFFETFISLYDQFSATGPFAKHR